MQLSSDSTDDSVMDELLSEKVVPIELVCEMELLLNVFVLLRPPLLLFNVVVRLYPMGLFGCPGPDPPAADAGRVGLLLATDVFVMELIVLETGDVERRVRSSLLTLSRGLEPP